MELHKSEQVARSQYNELLETDDVDLADDSMQASSPVESSLEQAAEYAELSI